MIAHSVAATGHRWGIEAPRKFFVVAALVGLGSANRDHHQPIGVHLDDPQLPEVQQRRPVDLKAALWENRRSAGRWWRARSGWA
jgi:hypothetical protein